MPNKSKDINLYDEGSQAVKDAYAMLMANIHFSCEKEPCKSLSICSCLPRVGKTTTAINLAISLSRAGWKTLLVDTDARKPDSFKRLNNDISTGLSDIIEKEIRFQDAVTKTNISNLHYLSSGKSTENSIEMFCSANFEKLVAEAKKQYDFIIFDTPALSTVIDGALVAAKTDASLLIAEIGFTKITTLKHAKEQLEKANAKVLGVVMTKAKKRDYKKHMESYNYFERFNKKADEKQISS